MGSDMAKQRSVSVRGRRTRKTLKNGVGFTMNKQRGTEKERTVEIGPLNFLISHSDLMDDQGVSIRVYGQIRDADTQILRFDCFDHRPHYHYDPDGNNEMHFIDLTTAGNPLGFALNKFRFKLLALLRNAGAAKLGENISDAELNKGMDEVDTFARELALSARRTVTHNRGDIVIEAGNIKFGLEYRNLTSDSGMAIHVLGDVAGQEVELLAFDCFKTNPHYHYGPRNKNIRIYWDKTMFPDTLSWTFKQFKDRKIAGMIQRAGYPGIANELDEDLIAQKLPAIEKQTWAILRSKESE
jgi:hypothetical protein